MCVFFSSGIYMDGWMDIAMDFGIFKKQVYQRHCSIQFEEFGILRYKSYEVATTF